jgi:hypothetical protein
VIINLHPVQECLEPYAHFKAHCLQQQRHNFTPPHLLINCMCGGKVICEWRIGLGLRGGDLSCMLKGKRCFFLR